MEMAPDPTLKADLARPLPPAQWADLSRAAAEPNAFYAPELFLPALDHLAGDMQVRVLEAHDGEKLIGILPVTVVARHGRFPVANVRNWMHDHCFFGAPLIRAGSEQAAWAAFLDQLDRAPWAPHFLHMTGLDAAGANVAALDAVCTAQRRPFRELQRYDRALLASDLSADAYWEANVRSKKRKELRRLQKRLAEMGAVESRVLTEAADLPCWRDDFLALEASGWKGANNSAIANSPADAAYFAAALDAAFAGDMLHFLRIDLDGRPIAMLVNFRHGRGAFSFKIAIDEELGRFSPGILIEIDNLQAVQGNADIDWMDSCAAANHSMIDSLWEERRSIAQYRIGLKGSGMAALRRKSAFAAMSAADALAKRIRERSTK